MTDQVTTSLAQAKVLVMEGQKGVSPVVTFEAITVGDRTGNRMTVTDADHPAGQSINILNGKDGDGGGGTATDAVLYTAQTLTDSQKEQARVNLDAYSKPYGGIPKTDLAADVQTSLGKADTALQQHQSLAGYATETYVQQQISAIPDELPSGGSTGDFLRKTASGVAWQTVPSAESNSFGGGA